MQKRISFETSAGNTLAGVLHTPDAGSTRAHALFAHCFTCTKNIKAAINIAEALCSEGIAVLRFDFTGLGQSEGDFADTHFSSNVQDLMDAASFLKRDYHAPENPGRAFSWRHRHSGGGPRDRFSRGGGHDRVAGGC